MQFLFPNLIIAVLHRCIFENLMILNCCKILFPNFLVAVLYHRMFIMYVLFFLPDETLEQGRNASR